jgi:hypothetical protein
VLLEFQVMFPNMRIVFAGLLILPAILTCFQCVHCKGVFLTRVTAGYPNLMLILWLHVGLMVRDVFCSVLFCSVLPVDLAPEYK